LKEEARRVHPIEACAMLFGNSTQKEAVVKKVVVAPNKLKSTVRFEINPETFAKTFIEADKEGLEFIGLFHSHPAPAKPSLIDLKYMKLWGNAIWLIQSLTDSNLAAYQMRNSEIREITIKVE